MPSRRTLVVVSVALLMTGCSTQQPSGFSRVHLETYPVDGTCELTGREYLLETSTPANIEYPAAAEPIIVECRADGYEGKAILDDRANPWSPANVGSLGLGALLGGSDDTQPTFRVTMAYTEAKATDAGKPPAKPDQPEERKDTKTASTGTGEAARPQPSKEGPAAMPASAPGGGVRVHLASFKEKPRADSAWKAMTRKTGKLLAELRPEIEQVDLGAKGKFFRVYAGGLKDMKAARDLCVDLQKRKLYCRPVAKGAN